MLGGIITISLVKSVLLELLVGYFVISILGHLILLPGKDKIQNVANKKDYEEAKKENIKARKWLCAGWSVAVIIFNLYLKLI